MSNEKLSKVNDMTVYTNTLFNSIKKTSIRSLVVFVELGMIAAIIAMMTTHNTTAMGILVIAGLGVIMNLYTIDSYNRDYAEFQKLCESITDERRSTNDIQISSADFNHSIDTLREATDGYLNKYKLVSIVNIVTLLVVAVLVCLIISSII